MLTCSLCIQLWILKQLISVLSLQHREGSLMTIQFSVHLINIHYCSFWKIRACLKDDAKLANMVREVVSEIHVHTVDIRFLDMILWSFWLTPWFILINMASVCNIVDYCFRSGSGFQWNSFQISGPWHQYSRICNSAMVRGKSPNLT